MRHLDDLKEHDNVDGRMVAIAITKLQEASMWAARAVFRPARPTDADIAAADALIDQMMNP